MHMLQLSTRYLLLSMIIVGQILLMMACQRDQASTNHRLLGTWHIVEASRNDKPTQSLDGLYLTFETEFLLKSNLLGDTMTFDVHIDGDRIEIQNDRLNHFSVTELTDSTLILETDIQKSALKIYLSKQL